ncbi:hypothetical protein BC936DRAFT_147875 [Jimgerdemannia flammicorona]|uniref:Zn(2)-C6 fungal-type domain-containing protein n=1 Tax=Jimgerdemannia flammicorona TaxID=994334 RepID=A0A433D4G7_9FUNG|nr:hypothetical protein BC936DRAFT_147875 [Jimgerdemannia flammicorona]
MDASLSLSAPTPEIPVIPKRPQRLLPSPPPTAPIPVSWKYKDCNDCTRLKKRCRSHRIRPPTNRTKPGKVCVRCKAKKRACPGFPCRRCEKAGKVCEPCPPSGGTARSIASTGVMDIDTDALDDTDDVKVAGRGGTPVAMASEDAPWLFPNLNGGTIGGWNESASNSGNFNMGSPGYSSVPSSSNNSSIPSSPFTGSMGNEMFIPGMSPEALPSVPSWITGVNDAQSEEDDFSRYTEIMNDDENDCQVNLDNQHRLGEPRPQSSRFMLSVSIEFVDIRALLNRFHYAMLSSNAFFSAPPPSSAQITGSKTLSATINTATARMPVSLTATVTLHIFDL